MTNTFKVCSRCVMDTSDPDIKFDDQGVCNHCHEFDLNVGSRVITGEDGKAVLQKIVERIKKSGEGNEYDCIVGISGGVDSTYVAYQCKQLGLRP